MDAYDLSDKLKSLWSDHFSHISGMLPKNNFVWAGVKIDDSFKRIVGVKWNEEHSMIEFILEEHHD